MPRIARLLILLFTNPIVFFKKLYTKLKKTPFKSKINGIVFGFDFSYDPAIKDMFSGTYEVETINALKKYLKPGDTFIDVGANIGYVSTNALGLVGKNGSVHSFEPVPKYFGKLKQVKEDNPGYNMQINNFALGEKDGQAEIQVTNLGNIGWNTMVPGFMSKDTTEESIKVPVYRLEDYIRKHDVKNIALIKIDTEGFEFPILKGLSGFLDTAQKKPVFIVEVALGAYKLLGNSVQQLVDYMGKYGYESYDIVTGEKVDLSAANGTTSVIFRVG